MKTFLAPNHSALRTSHSAFGCLRHCPLFIINFALAIGAISPLTLNAAITTRPPPAGNNIRVVTANLRNNPAVDYDTGNGWTQRRDICRDVLIALNADIYCFQECLNEHLDYIKPAMTSFEHFAESAGAPFNAILYSTVRFTLLDSGCFWLSPTPDLPETAFDNSLIRMVYWVRLLDRKTNREIIAWNTHLEASNVTVREKQAQVIVDAFAKIAPGIPLFLTGDMNVIANSNAMRAITGAGLTDTWATIHGNPNPGFTHHGFQGTDYLSAIGKIDFVFSSPAFVPVASEIVRDFLEVDGVKRYPSDHYFITADMAYASPEVVVGIQLRALLEAPGDATITVTGTADLASAGATLTPGKTIVGADIASTIIGSLTIPATATNATITGVNFSSALLNIAGAKDVTVTHCTFIDAPVTISGGSDNIDFSWNQFTATASGAGSAMTISDAGASNGILLHHNLWGGGLKSNMPSAANARVFMYNNYFTATGNTTATIAGAGAQILSVRNIYQDTNNPLTRQSDGLLRTLENFTDATTGTTAPGDDTVFVPVDSHVLFSAGISSPSDAAEVALLISANAGNTDGQNSSTPAMTDGVASITAAGSGINTISTGVVVPDNGDFTLTASATGFSATAHQWYRDNFSIDGAIGATYAVASATAAAHAGAYAVAMTTTTGEIVASGAFTVMVGTITTPLITTHPRSRTVRVGGLTTFTVAVTGEKLEYQWYKDGEGIAGATGASHTISNVQQNHAGGYHVVVSNPVGSDTSNAATLAVDAIADRNSSGGGGAPSLLWLGAVGAMLVARSTKRRAHS